MKTLASIAAVALLTGCAGVPATKFNIDPATGAISVESPKDWHADWLEATLPNGTHILIKNVTATNNPADIAIVANANATMAISAIGLAQSALARAPIGAAPLGMSQTVTNTVPVTVTNTFRITPE